MTKEIEILKREEREKTFLWRGRGGKLYNPKDMKTRHLFYTLKMIWNHSAPEDMKFKPYQEYNFSSFYTPEYTTKAVRFLFAELKTRKDILPYSHRLRVMGERIKKIKQMENNQLIN